MTKHCCERMQETVEYRCDEHPNPSDCPDNLVVYIPKFDEYGILIHDGGGSIVTIAFCPWCGSQLPKSKRERYFQELDAMGLEPGDDRIPDSYSTDSWWSKDAT